MPGGLELWRVGDRAPLIFKWQDSGGSFVVSGSATYRQSRIRSNGTREYWTGSTWGSLTNLPLSALDDGEGFGAFPVVLAAWRDPSLVVVEARHSDPTLEVLASQAYVIKEEPMNVTVTSPVSASGLVLTLVRGDDYFKIDGVGRVIEFVNSDGDWPALVGAVKLSIRVTGNYQPVFTSIGSVTAGAIGSPQKVSFDLASVDTSKLDGGEPPGKSYSFDVEATIDGGRDITLVIGRAFVIDGSTR